MKHILIGVIAALLILGTQETSAQLGRITQGLKKAQQAKEAIDEFTFSDAEEQQLGREVSGMLREKYGVVQDPAVHKYVALTGTVLAQTSSRPSLPWTFIVLDTDGVNAFAAPGGFVHITRGALALLQNEAELAGVLGHEISHVTAKHTVRAIQKNKAVQVGANAARSAIIQEFANRAYEMLLENAYDRGDEMDADKTGVAVASSVGYAGTGLGAFLARLDERNKSLQDRSGLFASHPETKARIDALTKLTAAQKGSPAALAAPRFQSAITYKPLPVTQVATSTPAPRAKAEPAEAKPEEKKPAGKFGLSGLSPLSREKSGTQTVASAGSRGVNPDRDAKGGPNSAPVPVKLSPAEIAEFKKGIA
jgi:beta-barrel assembly-enhancing protease